MLFSFIWDVNQVESFGDECIERNDDATQEKCSAGLGKVVEEKLLYTWVCKW
jgi:hypothetical protein